MASTPAKQTRGRKIYRSTSVPSSEVVDPSSPPGVPCRGVPHSGDTLPRNGSPLPPMELLVLYVGEPHVHIYVLAVIMLLLDLPAPSRGNLPPAAGAEGSCLFRHPSVDGDDAGLAARAGALGHAVEPPAA